MKTILTPISSQATKKPKSLNIQLIRSQQGFTLIEFMIAAILGLMVLLAIGGAYVATQRVNETANARITRQQELRLAGNMLIRDARMAGTFGCANVSALANSGSTTDHQPTKLNYNNDPSYFNLNPTLADEKVFSTRIVNAKSGNNASTLMQAINNGFVPSGNSILIFNYGINTQPLLTTTVDPNNSLTGFTLPTGGASYFAPATDRAKVVIASCGRLDILNRAQLTSPSAASFSITNAGDASSIRIPLIKTGVDNSAPATSLSQYHYGVQATISNLHTVAYVVGNVAGDTQNSALYRFELLDNGAWSPPQLLARNIQSMAVNYIYITQCPTSGSGNPDALYSSNGIPDEKYVDSSDAFIDDGTDRIAPTGVRISLIPMDTVTGVGDITATSAKDKDPIIMYATMRGANTCATR